MPLHRVRTGLVAALSVALLCSSALTPAEAAPPPPDVGTVGGAPDERSRSTKAKKKAIVPAKIYGPLGIDVSGWQPTVDWTGWWAKGKRWTYVKATEGTTFKSKTFSSQYKGSAKAGYIRGAYHYANPGGKSGWRQADWFIANGGGWSADGKTLPGMLDLEQGGKKDGGICYGLSQTQMLSWISSFRNRYREKTGRHVVIYTNASWWRACTGNTTRFSKSPLFIARWNTTPGVLPGGWKTWTLWQYTDTPLDQDMFNGSSAQLKKFAKGK